MGKKKSATKTQTLSTKLSDEHRELLVTQAKEKGISPSEFVRFAVLQELYTPRDLRIVMAELARLQHIVVSLLMSSLRGDELPDSEFQKIRSVAEKNRFQVADQRIAAALKAPASSQVLAALGAKDE